LLCWFCCSVSVLDCSLSVDKVELTVVEPLPVLVPRLHLLNSGCLHRIVNGRSWQTT
jgi:hypothetical protein